MGEGINCGPDPRRLIWVVTVHADMATDGTPARAPQIMHAYTVAIDAASGYVTDLCIGCTYLG